MNTVPKLFNELGPRYADRFGGYTRVLRIEPLKADQAPSAILELVDSPKDMRFAMTAKTIARAIDANKPLTDLTMQNIKKVTRYRKDGEKELMDLVQKMRQAGLGKEGESS